MTLALSGCTAAPPTDGVGTVKVVFSVHDLPSRLMVAHRGGLLRNPEASLESFHAAADAGFPLEMDIKALGDGTLVPSHDRTVERTMTGATGKLSSLSCADWVRLQIRAVGDGQPGTPTTWDELIDTFGGKILLVPQIDESGHLLERFIASVKDANLDDSVIVQSWSLRTSKRVAESGLPALQLVSETKRLDPEDVAAAGIEFVGVPMTVGVDYRAALTRNGLDVWAYTANTLEEAEGQYAKGAAGVFTDDLWLLSGAAYK